jgi:putative transposase
LSVALVRDVKDPWVLEIVNRTDAHNFVVLPKRWIVERTVVWITRNRRLMRDFER